MKILFFSHQASFIYGGEIVTLEMMRALKEAGVDVHFASPAGPYAERAKAIVPWHEVPSIEFSRSFAKLPKLIPAYFSARARLKEIIAKEKIDILHAQSLKATVYARGLDIPVVWHHHDIMPTTFANDLWLRWLARGVDAIVTPSEATKDALIESGLPEQEIIAIPNGFRVHEWKKRPPRGTENFTALVVGEISPRKGSDLIVEIAKASRVQNTALKILVVGEGLSDPDFAESVKSAAKEFPEIEFLGRRNDVRELLQSADALLVLSRQDPLPTVIVEAMLSGVPVVATPVGGIPEMVSNDETGFLCETPEEFAQKLAKLRSDQTLWQNLSEKSFQTAVKKYAIERVARELTSLYEELLRQAAR